MGRIYQTRWSNITCSAFHTLAHICAIGLGSSKKMVIVNDEVCLVSLQSMSFYLFVLLQGKPIFEFPCSDTPRTCSWFVMPAYL